MSAQTATRSQRWKVLRRSATFWVGGSIVAMWVVFAIFGDFVTPYDPLGRPEDILNRLQPPSAEHWFGTDQFGRDVFSRVLAGARASLEISLMSVALAVAGGLSLGVIAGFFGGWIDRAIAIVVDAVMAFPSLLLALGIMTVFGPSRYGVVLALGAAYTPAVIRVSRGAVLSLREKEFVEAARALGATTARQVTRHILPNSLGPVIVAGTIDVAAAIIAESTLSFLGLGFPPDIPTWGRILYDAKDHLDIAPHWALFPGGAIFLAVLSINFIGDGLRDALDPRLAHVS